jgi:ATP-dependent Clp protease ATP-binding subunit ClpC
MKDMLHKEVERYFRPEFLNRLDDIIVFKSLTREDLDTVVDYELRKVRDRLAEHGLDLELTDEAKAFLIDKGYNPDFGARPLRRAIEHHVEDAISEEILRGNYKTKTKIMVSVTTEPPAEGEEAVDDDDNRHLYFEGVGERPTEEPSEQVPQGVADES